MPHRTQYYTSVFLPTSGPFRFLQVPVPELPYNLRVSESHTKSGGKGVAEHQGRHPDAPDLPASSATQPIERKIHPEGGRGCLPRLFQALGKSCEGPSEGACWSVLRSHLEKGECSGLAGGTRLLDSVVSEVPPGTTITDIVRPLGTQVGVSSTAFSSHWEIQRQLRETGLIFIPAVSCAPTGGREGIKTVRERQHQPGGGGEKAGPDRSPLAPPGPSGCPPVHADTCFILAPEARLLLVLEGIFGSGCSL